MGRRVDVDDLVGTTEIAQRLGLSQAENVHTWRHRHPDFPSPIATIGRTMIWAWPDVQRWARATGRPQRDA